MDEREVLAKNLKRYRSSKGLSQKDLGIKVGMRAEPISNIELAKQRNIGLKYLILICREPGERNVSNTGGQKKAGQLFSLTGK
ncbi:hypothetical protein ES703_123432 [subsurface metagenome]